MEGAGLNVAVSGSVRDDELDAKGDDIGWGHIGDVLAVTAEGGGGTVAGSVDRVL